MCLCAVFSHSFAYMIEENGIQQNYTHVTIWHLHEIQAATYLWFTIVSETHKKRNCLFIHSNFPNKYSSIQRLHDSFFPSETYNHNSIFQVSFFHKFLSKKTHTHNIHAIFKIIAIHLYGKSALNVLSLQFSFKISCHVITQMELKWFEIGNKFFDKKRTVSLFRVVY